MKLSRTEITSRAAERTAARSRGKGPAPSLELALLVLASLVTIAAVSLTFLAKQNGLTEEQAHTVNLNQLSGPQEMLPLLGAVPPSDQLFVATQIYSRKRRGETFGNVGALARLRVTADEGSRARGATAIAARLRGRASAPLLTPAEFGSLKPLLRVRDASALRPRVLAWTAALLLAFYGVHLCFRMRRFTCDPFILPILHALCGVGFALMLSLRDPLRDTMLFSDFAVGVVAGCAALCVFALPDYQRRFSRLSYLPLIAALALALVLGVFGSGPGGSDAKVNLLFFQPMELIRILLVFFLAGYFAQNWDLLRYLRQSEEKDGTAGALAALPRLDYVAPVAAGVALAIALFFWLSDLGPALVLVSAFLTLYSIARDRVLLAASGLALVIAAFAFGYYTGYPHTVRERVQMWLSPWSNPVRGGDQLAHSLWALSTGGVTGTGLGLGDPQSVPAAHTDLVLSALGEQAGVLGLLGIFLLYAVLLHRTVRIAARASGTYSYFLAIGVALITGYQLLLISGGLLGLVPLSGVVSPFLSYGKTSMVANFALFGIVLALSHRANLGPEREGNTGDVQLPFRKGTRAVEWLLVAAIAVVVLRIALVGAIEANAILIRPSLVLQADGGRRYQYNPRLLAVLRELPKGTIYDRNGIPLATSDWSTVEAHRSDYARLGVDLSQTTSRSEARQYPLGAPFFYLLGDTRSRLKQGARNTAFEESASRIRLQGFDDVADVEEIRDPATGRITPALRRDFQELIPLVRHRYQPDHPQVKALLSRPRDVHMTLDAALQVRASGILARHLTALGKTKGALVIMNPDSGDTLAAVSYPWPSAAQLASLQTSEQAPLPDADLIDRARFGLYPPGSAFKIVTAIAALRKDPALAAQHYDCVRMPDGRIGNDVWGREIRDDVKDTVPHGSVDLRKGIVVSCNAFFAQLGAHNVGAPALFETATRLGINVASPNTQQQLQQFLPQASYGQGQVVASPFQMARVAATVANGGNAPEGRWILDDTNTRVRAPEALLSPALAAQLAGYMRAVVTSGTARGLNSSPVAIAGKTGTAELAHAPSHAWFIGFAPYAAPPGKRIAFAVLVENGQYGGTAAAPIAADLVAAARQLGII